MCVLLLSVALAGCQSASEGKKSVTAAGAANAVPATEPLAVTHGPILQAPSETGVTISWATSRKCVSKVEYRLESSPQWLSAAAAHHGLVDADTTCHNVPLAGLKPGTRYVYRIASREIVDFKPYKVGFGWTVTSPEHQFTTLNAAKPACSFVVLNDRHEKIAPLTASLDSVNWTNVDLVFLNGDMLSDVKDEPQIYRCVVDPCSRSFATKIPLVYVRGNHDARGGFARDLLQYFPTDSGRFYYALQHGLVSFLVLDSGEDKTDESLEYSGLVSFEPYLREQLQWLAKQIQDPAFQKARFRVCFLHIPPGKKPDPKFIRQQWLLDHVVPLLNQGKVDLLICAHTHKYATHPAGYDGMNFPMIIGGTETVIRCDVTADQIRVNAADLSGKPLVQLPPIKPRTGE